MTQAAESTTASTPPAAGKPRRWTIVMIILGMITAYGSALAANGYGWSPLLFLLFGAVATPILARLLTLRSWGWRAWVRRIAVLVLIGVACYGIAIYSRQIDPHRAFSAVFGIDPPSGAANIRARKQWYDGPNIAIVFTADRPAIDSILSKRKYGGPHLVYGDEPKRLSEEERRRRLMYAVFVPYVDRDWFSPGLMVAPVSWTSVEESAVGGTSPHAVSLMWDEATGKVVACAWFE